MTPFGYHHHPHAANAAASAAAAAAAAAAGINHHPHHHNLNHHLAQSQQLQFQQQQLHQQQPQHLHHQHQLEQTHQRHIAQQQQQQQQQHQQQQQQQQQQQAGQMQVPNMHNHISDSIFKAAATAALGQRAQVDDHQLDDHQLISNLYNCTGAGFEQAINSALVGDNHQQTLGSSYNKQPNHSSAATAAAVNQLDPDSLASLLSSASVLHQHNNFHHHHHNHQDHVQQQHHLQQQQQRSPVMTPFGGQQQQQPHNHLSHQNQITRQDLPVSSATSNHLSDSIFKAASAALGQRPLGSTLDDHQLISNLYSSSGFDMRNALGDHQPQQTLAPPYSKQHHIDTDSLASLLSSASLIQPQESLQKRNSPTIASFGNHSSQTNHLNHQNQVSQLARANLQVQSTNDLTGSMLKVATAGFNQSVTSQLQQAVKHQQQQQQQAASVQQQDFIAPEAPKPLVQPAKPMKAASYSAIVAKSAGLSNNIINNNNISNSSATSNQVKMCRTNSVNHNSLNNNNNVANNHQNTTNGGTLSNNTIGHSNSPILSNQSSILTQEPTINYASNHSSPAQQQQQQQLLHQSNTNHSNHQQAAPQQQSQTSSSSNTTPLHGSATNLLGFMGLYVGNLSPDLTKEQLEKIFSKYGEPVKAHRLIRSPVAFIKYENTESPRAAIEDLHGVLLPEMTLNPDQPLKLHFDRNDAQLKANYRPTELPPKADNGECYGWRTTVCRKGKNCPKKHIPINRGIDFQMWMIKSTPTSSAF